MPRRHFSKSGIFLAIAFAMVASGARADAATASPPQPSAYIENARHASALIKSYLPSDSTEPRVKDAVARAQRELSDIDNWLSGSSTKSFDSLKRSFLDIADTFDQITVPNNYSSNDTMAGVDVSAAAWSAESSSEDAYSLELDEDDDDYVDVDVCKRVYVVVMAQADDGYVSIGYAKAFSTFSDSFSKYDRDSCDQLPSLRPIAKAAAFHDCIYYHHFNCREVPGQAYFSQKPVPNR